MQYKIVAFNTSQYVEIMSQYVEIQLKNSSLATTLFHTSRVLCHKIATLMSISFYFYFDLYLAHHRNDLAPGMIP